MVRNYDGSDPAQLPHVLRPDLQALGTRRWQDPSTWRPQVVVIGLGINDFSTALNAGEQWATSTPGRRLPDRVPGVPRQTAGQYGPGTHIVLTYPDLSYTTTAFADSIKQIVQERNTPGDTRVYALVLRQQRPGAGPARLRLAPVAARPPDPRRLLNNLIATLPLTW